MYAQRLVTLVLCLAPLCLPTPCRAEEPAERLARLRSVLDTDESNVRLWWYGWGGLYAAAGGVQTGLAAFSTDPNRRVDSVVGATSSWLGVAGMALTPVKPGERWTSLPDAPVDLQLRMVEAELRDRARREHHVGGWVDYTLCVLVALGAGAYVWLHENRPSGALMAAIPDLVIGELELWTVPHTAVHAVEALDAEKAP